jgi:hypothetical protein
MLKPVVTEKYVIGWEVVVINIEIEHITTNCALSGLC